MFSDFQLIMNMGPTVIAVFFILAIWSIVWKGFALWIAAREGKKWWFAPILIFNTVGILEIIYILFFSEAGKKYIAGFKKYRASKKVKKEVKTKSQVEEVKKAEEASQVEKKEEAN